MSDLYLYNTLNKSIEQFIPIDVNRVGMYFCGPTLYDKAHIGNLRSSVTGDLLFRILRLKYGAVKYVRNYTDVDDKIIEKAKKLNVPTSAVVSQSASQYINDMDWLGNHPPTHTPYATFYIDEMISMIQHLIDYNYAYEINGAVYFETELFQVFGRLSGRKTDDSTAISRLTENTDKRHHSDFALWKPSPTDELGWMSPWGYGRPGWHIECSTMAAKILGKTFDIHGGGSDLMFPHHENEIAQSCAAHSTDQMANYWVHSGMLNVSTGKMSKSLGNVVTSQTLQEQNISGEALRLVFLSTHYRSVLNFSDESIEQARTLLTKWYEKIMSVTISSKYSFLTSEVKDLLFSDMNTPAVIAKLHEYYENDNIQELTTTLLFLGFRLQPIIFNDKKAKELLEKRNTARQNKDYAESDKLRDEIISMGYDVNDAPEGTELKQKFLF